MMIKKLIPHTLTVLLFATPCFADSHVELILDASGSMFNKLDDGRYRITAAKEVLASFVRSLPNENLHVGLRIYGSQLKPSATGACRDSRLAVPMRGVDRPALLAAVRDTQARGKTPIAYSLEEALKDFPEDSDRCVIILVTDGEEVCDGDVKATAEKLEQRGCEMDLRIIGFDLTPEAVASFAGVGKFENATDAEGLAAALDRAVDEVVDIEPLGAAGLEAPDEVVAGQPFEVTWKAEEGYGDYVTLVLQGTPDGKYGDYMYTEKGNPMAFHAPITTGDYELRYQSERVEGVAARRGIRVTPAKIAIQAPSEIDAGRPFEVPWVGPDSPGDYITLVEKGAADGAYTSYQYTRDGSPAKLHAPFQPGDYELRYQSEREDGVFARRPIQVRPMEVALNAPAEVPAGGSFEVAWRGPDGKDDYVTIVPASAADGKYASYAYTKKGPMLTLQAPVEDGEHEIRYQSEREDGVFARLPVTVLPLRASVTGPDEVAAGSSFEVTWEGPDGANDYITIVAKGAEAGAYLHYVYTRQGSPVTLNAPDEPGEYELRYQSDRERKKIFASRAIRVK